MTRLLGLFLLVSFLGCEDDALDWGSRFWISDSGTQRLLSMDRGSGEVFVQGYWSHGITSLALMDDGTLFALDPVEKQLYEVNPVNAVLQPIGFLPDSNQPLALCTTLDERLYLLDGEDHLLRLSPLDGRVLQSWAIQPPGHYQSLTLLPHSIAAPNGELAERGDLLLFEALPAAGRLVWLKLTETVAHAVPLTQTRPLRALCVSLTEGRLLGVDEESWLLEVQPESGEVEPLWRNEELPASSFFMVIE
jgi:hypothetical protein